MKTNALLVSCLLLASSSAAIAGPSFSFQARFRTNVGSVGPVIRDHRAYYSPPAPPAAPPTRPVTYVDADDSWRRDHDERFYRPAVRALPAVTGPTWDCHNWDPTVETSSVCAAYGSTRGGAQAPSAGPGILLGVRDAAVPDHQYITVGAGRRFRSLVIEGNACATEISRVAIKFMDGSVQVVNANDRLRDGERLRIDLDGGAREINQLVIYTPNGATGSYAVFAR